MGLRILLLDFYFEEQTECNRLCSEGDFETPFLVIKSIRTVRLRE